MEPFNNFFKLCPQAEKFFEDHKTLILTSKGSRHNHQAWEGGYVQHVKQCFIIADGMFEQLSVLLSREGGGLTFSLTSALKVLFFHDIEKIWAYTNSLPADFNKQMWYEDILPTAYGLIFTGEELNALKYIHGENEDYNKNGRTMNELAAFCHCVDTISARIFHSLVI